MRSCLARSLVYSQHSINASYFKAGFFKSRERKPVRTPESQEKGLETQFREMAHCFREGVLVAEIWYGR